MRSRSITRSLVRGWLALMSVAATGALTIGAGPAGATAPAFANPSAITVVGKGSAAKLWISNAGNGSLTEVDAANPSNRTSVPKSTLQLGSPQAIIALASHLLVAGASGAVSELTTQGAFIAKLSVPMCTGGSPKLAAEGTNQIVELCNGGMLTSIAVSPTSMRIVRQIPSAVSGLSDATAVAVVGTTAYVTSNKAGTSNDGVVELSLAMGTKIRSATNANGSYAFDDPEGIATNGIDLWVTNGTTSTMTELSVDPMTFVGFMADAGNYAFWYPGTVIASQSMTVPTNLYVASVDGAGLSMATHVVSSATDRFSFQWMWCNSNGTNNVNFPGFRFFDPSGLALADGSLWVINAGDGVLDQMDASSGWLTDQIS